MVKGTWGLILLIVLLAGCIGGDTQPNTDSEPQETTMAPISTQPPESEPSKTTQPIAVPSEETELASSVQTSQDSTTLSTLKCEKDPKIRKGNVCNCSINEDKNKLTVILKKTPAYENDAIKTKVSLFLDSVQNDLGTENIGIRYFDGDSIADLNQLIDNLYLTEDVGYAIIVEDELDLWSSLYENLSLVNKDTHLPRNEEGLRDINPDYFCKDVAVSMVPPPFHYTDTQKTEFIGKIFDTYTKYHNNEEGILSQYSDSYLHIQWENGHPNLGMDLTMQDKGYSKTRVLISNYDTNLVEEELKKKPYLIHYNVHGNARSIGLGLNPNDETGESQAVYTTLDEFTDFTSQNGAPSLLVEAGSCGAVTTEGFSKGDEKVCCWPQTMLNAGIWSYYSLGGSGDNLYKLEEKLSTSPFYGYAIRHNMVTQYIIFGDITAHFN